MSLPHLFIPKIPGVNSANLNFALSPYFDIISTVSPPDYFEGVRIVLPGNGSFGTYTSFLRDRGWYSYLHELTTSDCFHRIVAICSGFQSLCLTSAESTGFSGMDLYPFHFCSLKSDPFELSSVINLGRSDTFLLAGKASSSVHSCFYPFDNLNTPYYVHGFACRCSDMFNLRSKFDLLFVSSVNNVEFLAGFLDQSLLAVQFHPELSGPHWRSTLIKFLLH